jgi:hypothetical protein
MYSIRTVFWLVLSTAGSLTPAFAEDPDYPVGNNYVFSPYGQIHFSVQSFDDGKKRTTNLVDITNANSRAGFYFQPTGNGDGLSFQFETGLGFRPSSSTSQIYTPEFFDWSSGDLRQVQLIYKGGMGTIRLGQGSMPLDGVAESDLGGTVVVAKSTIPEANGDYIFRTTGGALSGVTVGDAFNNFDGARRMRVRYDTPEISGFSLAAAYGKEVLKSGINDDYYDVALRYNQSFGEIKVTAAVGSAFARNTSNTVRSTVGSISLIDTRSGLNASLASGLNAYTGENYVYLKGGWNTKLLPFGDTKLVVEGFRGNDYLTTNAKSSMWGVGVIQNIDNAGLEAYLGYRAFAYEDDSSTAYQGANAVQLGARWRF